MNIFNVVLLKKLIDLIKKYAVVSSSTKTVGKNF